MKKILTLIMLLLAVHFLAVAGGVGWLVASGRLDKEKVGKIGEVMFPAPTSQPTTVPTTAPVTDVRPLLKLEELLAKQAGRPATEQVEFIRNAFDEQYAQLERRMREMEALQRQIESARDQLGRDRQALDERQKMLDSRETEAARLEQDQGFQAELQLYQSMPSPQVKKLFIAMEDDLVARYLQAMPTRQASKVIKEFKTPEETARLQQILERIRKAAPTSPLGKSAEPTSGGGQGTTGGGQGGPGGGSGAAGGGLGAAGGVPNSASAAGSDAERGAGQAGGGQGAAGR